jgi:hypothetical protein
MAKVSADTCLFTSARRAVLDNFFYIDVKKDQEESLKMASAVVADESDDFVTCPVCLCEYDQLSREPKFLPCSHTLCLTCKKIFQ